MDVGKCVVKFTTTSGKSFYKRFYGSRALVQHVEERVLVFIANQSIPFPVHEGVAHIDEYRSNVYIIPNNIESFEITRLEEYHVDENYNPT